ncbi:MAG TPA: metal-dependent hydrolase [Ignavibacteriales bacterium]|nr:metal-dependent hydrolase [Ignavibacteriales bacterium]HOL81042.1 metal-dependent hydrolase [Ignavibacteriales bacterium]HOM64777.1 metal-dependent hydrolase [Ignavibacteriales bacterium]HPD68493.1 metal-dependent hydrolase [Ignavibacteriales bacterium]HPP32822.1 metal-dependent hydrolase [Ignavibacteriales bacterium]
MKLTYFGHSAFQIITNDNKSILIDPFITGNPLTNINADNVYADYIIVTHGHGDHLGDTLSIASRCNSLIIATNELANYCANKGCRVHNMHIGGSHKFDFGKVKFTLALHGSETPDGVNLGLASGVILTIEDKTIYHTGDTGLFGDMKLIGELHKIDYLLLPIGDNFTMGIEDAIVAVEFIKPKNVIPMHYNTFPVISNDPESFANQIKAKGYNPIIIPFNESIDL